MRRIHRKRRRGAEAIEFAMILLFFPSIVLGMLEFGRAFEVSQWLTAAAREGARLAMLYNVINDTDRNQTPPITTANQKVEIDIKNFLKAARINSSAVKVFITTPEAATADPDGNPLTPPVFVLDDFQNSAGEYFKVRVEVPFEDVSYLVPTFLDGMTLAGQIIVRHE